MVASNTSHARGTATTHAQFDIGCTEEAEGVENAENLFVQGVDMKYMGWVDILDYISTNMDGTLLCGLGSVWKLG